MTLLKLATPVLFSLVAEPLTGLVDTAFVARLPGAEPVAALGVGTVAFTSIFWAFTFLAIGTQTELAQGQGSGDHEHASRVATMAVVLAACIGLALLSVTPFLPDIAALLGGTGLVSDLACEYMLYRLLGAPAVLVVQTSFGALRGVQDMRTPLLVAVGMNAANVLLDWVLIFGMGPIPPLGVAGAALASALSQWLGALWILYAVNRRIGLTTRFRGAGMGKLIRVGGDLFVRTGMVLLFLGLCTRVANLAGPSQGAAHQAIRQFFIFSALFLDAFAITGQSLVGYFLGAGDYAQARRVASRVCWWSLGTGAAIGAAMILGRDFIVWLLVPPEAVAVFSGAWLVVALFQPVGALSFATDGIHWGTGDFRYLRNVMIIAALIGAALVLLVEAWADDHVLTLVWLSTVAWTMIRATFGLLRVWPGIGHAPLKRERGREEHRQA